MIKILLILVCLSMLVGCYTLSNPTAYKCKECGYVVVVTGALLPGHGARRNCGACGAHASLRVLKRLTKKEYKEAKRKGYYSY